LLELFVTPNPNWNKKNNSDYGEQQHFSRTST
jgi:hypothetical protein